MNHVMIDLESLGTEPGSVILSISAIQFDIETGKTGKQFHENISLKDCLRRGLKIDPGTFFWWMKQSNKSRERLLENEKCTNTVEVVFHNLYHWFQNLPHKESRMLYPSRDIIVWGRGPRMDQGLLSYVYKLLGYDETPWHFRNERCVRTMEALRPDIKKNTEFKGVLHYGPDDAKHQTKYVSEIYNQLKAQ